MARGRRRHGAGGRRRGRAESGVRARHRRADARARASRPLPDGRVTPRDARVFGLALAGAGLALLALVAEPARGAARARDARHLPGRLHADEAAVVARDARRRRAGRAAAAHRMGRQSHGTLSRRRRGRSSRSCSSGRFRTSWPSPGCTATTTGSAGFPMLPVVEPDGRRTGRQAVRVRGRAAARQPGADPGRRQRPAVLLAGARAGRRRCSRWPLRFASRRSDDAPRASCSSGRSPTCR